VNSSKKQWDVFISHASEDKESFARPLAEGLIARGLGVWYDDFALTIGDSLRRSINRGLSESRFGVVVISRSFLSKEWPQKELDALAAREGDGLKVILPVWHEIDKAEILKHSPSLADRLAARSSDGLKAVVESIISAITSCDSLDTSEPLKYEEIAARETTKAITSSLPFILVDEEFPLFRVPGSNIPFPSRREYLDGDVPCFTADSEIEVRLQNHGWACILDVASVGKTTLALRTATNRRQQLHPVFYLDLKEENIDETETNPVGTIRRLARPGTLIIVDNLHHNIGLARRLWQHWSYVSPESRGHLLLIGTEIHQSVVVGPEHDLTFFRNHPTNSAITLDPTAEDLGHMAKYIYKRVAGATPLMPEPPASVLAEWHCDYRAALNGFSFAVLNSLANFQKGAWSLPPSRASEWVEEKWLKHLDAREIENVICLAAFGAQDLEIRIPNEALPNPSKVHKLYELGLISESRFGRLGQYRTIELREPGWGRLILAARNSSIEPEQVRFAAAARNPEVAVYLASRLCREGISAEWKRLWEILEEQRERLAPRIFDFHPGIAESFLRGSILAGKPHLTFLLWQVIESQPEKLVAIPWDNSLNHVALILELANKHKRKISELWQAIESQPNKVAAAAWEMPLDGVGFFFEVAKKHGRDTVPLWEAIENPTDKLAAAAWSTPLERLGSFFEIAKKHGRDTVPLWEAIESELGKFAEIAWATPLDNLGSFFEVAKKQGRDTAPLWEAVENEPGKLASTALAAPLNGVGSFFDVSKKHGRDSQPLCQCLEEQSDRLAQRGFNATLLELVGFCHHAPPALFEIVLRDLKPGHWDKMAMSESMVGATWVIGGCAKIGRNDLATDLSTLLLGRASCLDFKPRFGGFTQMCWLLSNIPTSAYELVDPFCELVCTEEWLDMSFDLASCGQLASGLREIALNQPMERCQQFHHRRLSSRLNAEFSKFHAVNSADRSSILQLVGCAELCGWKVVRPAFCEIGDDIISDLLLEVLPLQNDATKVEVHQFQLWLGVRVYVSTMDCRVCLPRAFIEQTFELWKLNLEESSSTPLTVTHRLNQSMVGWLESCLFVNPPALVPEREPLWLCTGFPHKIERLRTYTKPDSSPNWESELFGI